MSTTYSVQLRPDHDGPCAMARAVALDMESIFGAQLRPAAPVAPRFEPEVLSRTRGWARLAAVGLLSVTAAAGVFAGKSVTATPAGRPATSEPARISVAPPARVAAAPVIPSAAALAPARVPAAAATADAAPAEAEAEAEAAEAAPLAVAATRTYVAAPSQPLPAARPRLATPAYEPRVAAAAPAPVTYREAPAATPAPAPTRIVVDCDRDPDACLAARMEWADRRTGEAFETAAAAGVQPKLLREYQAEWNRARGKADDRPDVALRIMAMITHDLKQLTNRADLR